MLLFSLLLLIPLISAVDPPPSTADLGFTCDAQKCTFTLAIPQSAVSFVDVGLLEDEIVSLNSNVSELNYNEKLINDEEGIFNADFEELYNDAQSNLTAMFDTSEALNTTATTLIATASEKLARAVSLMDALNCMVKNGLPSTCGKDIPDTVTTPNPGETTDETKKPEEPFTGSTTTLEPFTGTTTTEAPFTGTTTTEAPFTGSTTTAEVITTTTGPTESTQSTTEGPTQGTVTDESTTAGTQKTEPTEASTSATDTTSTPGPCTTTEISAGTVSCV